MALLRVQRDKEDKANAIKKKVHTAIQKKKQEEDRV